MAQFPEDTKNEIIDVARRHGLDPALLLAICEVESGGHAFAMIDGRREPLIRFEGHWFDRLIADPQNREIARTAGLSSPKAGAVANPATQKARWALLARAEAVDRTAALQSVSWGLGQIMGFHWKALGFSSVEDMVAEARSGVAGQAGLMMRFLAANNLLAPLRERDFEAFARRYNGPGYARNGYHTKLAAAFRRHKTSGSESAAVKAPSGGVLKRGDKGPTVADLQRMLTTAGHPVAADGDFGARTEKAVRDFQRRAGISDDGIVGPKTFAALKTRLPRTGSVFAFLGVLRRILPSLLRILGAMRR